MTTRRTPRSLSVAGLLTGLIALLALVAPPANAADLTISDPLHDNAGRGLDIVSAMVDNADYEIRADVTFAKHLSGNVIVGLKAHDRGQLRVVTSHDTDGRDRTLLLNRSGRVDCDGLTASWNTSTATVTLQVPSTCLWQGNYGAVRPWVLTEPLRSGSDVDFAETKEWIARG